MNDSFRLILKSLDLSVAKAAVLFGVPDSTMQGYAHKERPVPPAIRAKAEEYFFRVERMAQAFWMHPERLVRSNMPPVLRRAVERRIQEIVIMKTHKLKG